MFDGFVNGAKAIVRHYARGTAKETGETIVGLSMACFASKDHYFLTIDGANEWLKFSAQGKPYKVEVITHKDSRLVFTALYTGDGLTFKFGDEKCHTLHMQEVIEVMKQVITGL